MFGETISDDRYELTTLVAKGQVYQRQRNPKSWLLVVWPLIFHILFAFSIAQFVLHYVNNRDFNIEDRDPLVELPSGNYQSTGYGLLQSDVTTIVSALLALLRLILGCWLGPLCWRCAYILLETTGLTHSQLSTIISYGVPRFPLMKRKATNLVIFVVMILAIPVNVFAPVLTGSITWRASNRLTNRVPDVPILVHTITDDKGWEAGWNYWNYTRQRTAIIAAGSASIAWNKGAQHEPGWSKRVLRSYDMLRRGSEIANITLPYFQINSIEWIVHPNTVLNESQLNAYDLPCRHARLQNNQPCPLETTPGSLALIPSTDPPPSSEPFPNATIISERRLMVLYSHWGGNRSDPDLCPKPGPETLRFMSDEFPEDIDFIPSRNGGKECWAFAWVNFTAGAANCIKCQISSFATVQNQNQLSVQEDLMTGPSLRLMPTVISSMALMNSSLPSPWRNVTRYVQETLGRSYAVSWAAMTEWLGESNPRLATTFIPTVPSSRAQVDQTRVYLWLTIQIMVTLSGAIFLLHQRWFPSPLVEDMTLEPFYLDTTEFYKADEHKQIKDNGVIRLVYEEDRPKLKID